ncbi:amidohydrolase [Rhodohalobacter sp. SW132]|uniref:M20 metallopeptidase family protein n=1 Tax=Rhodohalobacter sp. SW132 TaxID=2293433 RepID=UPI000E229582|nr:amidohydrolase [Rhodohalobacter sp. SW132]REL33099.1 amidohydrolase [Rhodohalobacter sp. SW132]
MADLRKTIEEKAKYHFDYMVQTRRYLHKNPEISFKEFETTDYIIHELKKLGIETHRPLETGCVGVIEGGKTSDRVIALRADIDALEMEEEGEAKIQFISERPGAAHCCGHDAHTANLLGAAHILTEMQDEIEGKILLIFQPAEESLPGGGRLLSESGFLQEYGVQAIYGLHTNPTHKPGTIATKPGPLMARPDEFEITIKGTGGHAASPHLTVDPIVLLGQVITQFQTIISRSVDPTDPAVVTIGRVRAGSTYNVIPAKAELIGTVRTFSQENAYLIRDRMEAILKGVAEGSGGGYEFEFNEGYPAVVNNAELTDRIIKTARTYLGDDGVIELKKPIMAGEDFAFYQQHFPGAFFFLGSGSEEADSQWSWHHPRYNVDEKCMLTGSALMAGLVLGE